MSDEKPDTKKAHDDLVETAKKRHKIGQEASSDIRRLGLEDLAFRAGDQWPEDIKREREIEGRPTIIINRIPQFVKQITNDSRQNKPSIKVYPVDNYGDVETAKIYQGMIRHIENNSNAEVAYATALEGAVIKGFGYYRINTKYVDPTSFDQEITIEQIEDDFSVTFDPYSKEPDGSDANWAFISERFPRSEYEAEFGESELATSEDWASEIGNSGGWITEDTVLVVEYFYKEFKEITVCQIAATGQSMPKSELEELYPQGIPEGTVSQERKAKVPYVKWCKINGIEVLEETEWLGSWIPIIPVYGDKLIVDGKKIYEGIVRHAKDPQRMLNYSKSTEAETIALAPKTPFIVAEGQIAKPYINQWATANRKTHAYLTYKPTTFEGHLVSPPMRQSVEPATGALTAASMQAADDLKATTGLYDGAMGAQSNETSGKAILARGAQAQTANYHFNDNLVRSIKHGGRQIVELIPKIYDAARAQVILGEEDKREVVLINQEFQDKGQSKFFNLNKGKYDVVVDTGPTYATKRQEAADAMMELAKSIPQLGQLAPDLIVKSLDVPGAQELAERLKKGLPPGIAEDDKEMPISPQVKGQLEQMNQMIEALTAQLNSANESIKTKSLETESKERIEAMKQETSILIEKMKLAHLGAELQVNAQLKELQVIQDQSALKSATQAQNQMDAGAESAMAPQDPNQPTDGISSGQSMGGM
jgi:hypothetical protein